ncbi:hypothetical protein FSP39_013190 [Pinctada imbricata]|uniref:Uncharacterized protein n=1 Tax=Pinctada imbricata TaxID=66713 RepID=A0AA88Y6C5_PINIB|nr:hypothetical protein FSP39_013190 [Pinctada imbricata]
MSRASIVESKYGARGLIEMPPIALEGDRRRYHGYQDVPNHMFRQNTGGHRVKVYHQPPSAPQPSLTSPPMKPSYHEYVIRDTRAQHYQQPPPQPQQQAPPPPPPPPLPQPTYSTTYQRPPPHSSPAYPYSNIVQNSNVVPYDTYNPPPPPPPPPVAPPVMPAAPAYPSQSQNYYPNQNGTQDANGEIHIYYGPNGERLPGPVTGPGYPTDFTLEGTLEYGKLVSVRVRNSNISYRDIPASVLRDIERMYGVYECINVKIVAQGGEYNVYATPAQRENSERHYGYMYEPPAAPPHRGHGHGRHHPRRGQSASDDKYTKIYR